MILPDFKKGSLVNLMSSVLGGYGISNGYDPLSVLKTEEVAASKNVVLIVLDGLGYNYLISHAKGTIFQKYLRGKITSVFPSITATAITTFLTGVAPGEHGITAWFMYLKELGMVARILPFTSRFGHLDLKTAKVDPRTIFDHLPIFEKLKVKSYAVNHRDLAKSQYNVANNSGARINDYRTLVEFFGKIERIIKATPGKKYISAYWGKFDELCHKNGVKSKAVKKHFKELASGFEALVSSLAGTNSLLIVTADHGLMNVKKSERVNLKDHPELSEVLAVPLCGEPRIAYCYVRPGKTKQFEEYVKKNLGKYCTMKKSEELVKMGWFGFGKAHPRLLERIGDYTLIMKENYIILDRMLGEKEVTHIGFHGGISSDEMLVPLVVIPLMGAQKY